jgi:hypothetical protein
VIADVELFVNYYKIDEVSFWWGELVFLLWNCTNDFISGWFMDSGLLQGGAADGAAKFSSRVATTTVVGRVRGLLVGGPLMGLAFLGLLFRWPYVSVGVQFTVSLCVYDGFLTWVDLSYNALLSDLAADDKERAKMNVSASIFSTFGSASVFVSHYYWDASDLTGFRQFALVAVLTSGLGFVFAARTIRHEFRPTKPRHSSGDGDVVGACNSGGGSGGGGGGGSGSAIIAADRGSSFTSTSSMSTGTSTIGRAGGIEHAPMMSPGRGEREEQQASQRKAIHGGEGDGMQWCVALLCH